MSILATMPPKASSASSPCSAGSHGLPQVRASRTDSAAQGPRLDSAPCATAALETAVSNARPGRDAAQLLARPSQAVRSPRSVHEPSAMRRSSARAHPRVDRTSVPSTTRSRVRRAWIGDEPLRPTSRCACAVEAPARAAQPATKRRAHPRGSGARIGSYRTVLSLSVQTRGAAESFVSFIPLFDGGPFMRLRSPGRALTATGAAGGAIPPPWRACRGSSDSKHATARQVTCLRTPSPCREAQCR